MTQSGVTVVTSAAVYPESTIRVKGVKGITANLTSGNKNYTCCTCYSFNFCKPVLKFGYMVVKLSYSTVVSVK